MPESRFELERGDYMYPEALNDLENPPARLYVRGDPSVLKAPSLSIVGARAATPYGLAISEMAARLAVEAGLVVVSGGALGCDGAAGRAAISAGGRHVVVLGTGADVVYPRASHDLIADAIRTGGAVISLERWGSPPRRYAFPKRNRVIAALSSSTLVAEAGMPSGTFSTAETAAQIGREVLSVPGSILSPGCRGSNYLISIGATCIHEPEALEAAISRIYGTLRRSSVAMPSDNSVDSTLEHRVMAALTANPMRVDEVSRYFDLSSVEAMKVLGDLGARGLIAPMYDGRFALTKSALHDAARLGQNRGLNV